MKYLLYIFFAVATAVSTISIFAAGPINDVPSFAFLSPSVLAASKDGKTLFVACAANRVWRRDIAGHKELSVSMRNPPSGLVLSPDGIKLFVTCAAPESEICIVDTAKLKVVATIPGGHSAIAPVVSPDGKTLYVCNQFNNDVSVIDLVSNKETMRIAVQREPVAADITKDGKYLLVANQLHTGPADAPFVGAVVSVIDTAAGKVVKDLRLPHGSGSLKDVRISPDGKNAAVTHLLGRFYHPTTDVFRGWINANALSIIDMATMSVRGTILLDEPDKGAANPWGAAWTADGSKLLITHAGSHEVSVIDFPTMLAELPPAGAGTSSYQNLAGADEKTAREQAELSNYSLPYLINARVRVKLAEGDLGPRAVVVAGHTAYVANYFSDSLGVIDLSARELHAESIPLGPKPKMDLVRQGEFHFHDASICYQSWQSCSSCHPGSGRSDALNWDLLNDGTGNPKNTKNLMFAHQMPPVMSLGVRTNAETAVRAGIKFILFTNQPESVAQSLDAYLKSLTPVPSPYLEHGQLSAAAQRGKQLFSRCDCEDCHVPGLYADLHSHDVGTVSATDKPTDRFYTPTLVEVWRSAPYLHNGSAATIRDVLTTCNPSGRHGNAADLTKQEMDDLCAYVLSL